MADRDQLLEDSGLHFTEAGLAELDKLSWPELSGLVTDLVEQSKEIDRLCLRDDPWTRPTTAA